MAYFLRTEEEKERETDASSPMGTISFNLGGGGLAKTLLTQRKVQQIAAEGPAATGGVVALCDHYKWPACNRLFSTLLLPISRI